MAWGLTNVIAFTVEATLPCFSAFVGVVANLQAKPVLIVADAYTKGWFAALNFFHFIFL